MLLVLRVTGKAALDFSPVKGATMLAWAGAGRAVEATAAVETIIEEAISLLFYLIVELLLLPVPLYKPFPLLSATRLDPTAVSPSCGC